jgi:hypothetical protein
MRHAFQFPAHIRDSIRRHVYNAVTGVSPQRFRQEPAYTAALIGRLDGTAYDGPDGSVIFRSTNVDSIGRGAAERWSGGDFAITAEIRRDDLYVAKAILAQAKLGTFDDLSSTERDRLIDQIVHMRHLTRSPKVLFIPDRDGTRQPIMASGVLISEGLPNRGMPLPDYFVRRILTTFDGDTRAQFVDAVQNSSLEQLRVIARLGLG